MSPSARQKANVAGTECDPAAYDYVLPEGRIASRPVAPRDRSRLLLLRRGVAGLGHHEVRDLPGLLNPGDLLVVNETRVIPARVKARLEDSGRSIELLLLREAAPGRWLAWVRPGRSLRPGQRILFDVPNVAAQFLRRREDSAEIAFEGEVSALLASCGHVPLPPYIRRPDDSADREDYQTIFARVPGAVAAPTAGLHFTPELLDGLAARGVGLARILLHVGPGTFRPVRVSDLREHRVEEEYFEVGEETAGVLATTRRCGGRVIAVGTTSARALESWARLSSGGSVPRQGWTDLTIVPPFEFRAVDGLMTNFHLPRSSLLILVSAFAGRETLLQAYDEAIRRGYRFYSYGDAMLIL